MGLIGSILPALKEEDGEPSLDALKANMTAMKEWLKLLYAEVVDPRENMEWAEVDVMIATDENDVVLDFVAARISIDDENEWLYGHEPEGFPEFADDMSKWARAVPNMRYWTWFHIHPEGASQPGDKDEAKVPVLSAVDLINTGHLGGPRHFQSFAVAQRAGIVALQNDKVNGISPKIDAQVSRVFANTYSRVLGYDHPLAVAMTNIADAFAEFVETIDESNVMKSMLSMISFMMETMRPLQDKLEEARADFDLSEDEFRRAIEHDYQFWVADEEPSAPVRPAVQRAEPLPELLPELSAGVLADLANFNFDSLDT